MKSFFTKLGTLLLCGVAVAVVGCTDFSQDIQAVDKKVDDLTQNTETDLATINKALKDLEAKITADFATKKEVADLKATLEGSLASQVEALTGQINDVNDALKAAESKVNAAVAELDSKKADKTAVDAAIADAKAAAEKAVTELQGKLEAAQAELEKEIEGVTAEIADVQKNLDEAKAELEKKLAEGDAALQEDIDQAHAKADQLFGQLEALAPYLQTLQAQILENKGTLEALSAYLPELKAELEEEIDNVDAKALELKNDLLSLTAHLKEYEAANDAKVLELKGTLDALSAHLGEYEKTTDAKLTELQNTFFALSEYLEEQFAAIEAADDAIYEEIASNFAATNSAITALNNLLEDLTAEYKAADDAIYAEMAANFAVTNETISSVYAQHLELAARVDGIDASLKAQIAAFEAFKAAYEDKVAELEATDTDLYGQYTALQEAISTVNNLIEDLKKEDENLASEINGVRENLTQLMNSINDRIDTEVEALKADALQKFNGLISIIAANEERMNDRFEHVFGIVAELDERVAANESAIAALQQTVEMLEMWAEAHGSEYNQLSQLVANIYALTGEIEERVGALEVEDGRIYEFIGQTATNLNNLIEDVTANLEDLWAEVAANKNECGAAVLALQNLIEDLNKTLTGRIEDLENRLDVAEGKIADLEEQTAALEEAVVALQGAHATLTEQLQNKLTVLDNQIADLQESTGDNADAIAKLQEAHAILTEQLQNKLTVIDDQIEDLTEAIEDNKNAIEKNGAAIEDNAELIAENAELIVKTQTELAELQGNFQAFAQNVEMVITNHASSIESLTDELDGVLEVIEDINADIDGIQEDLTAAIGRIEGLEEAVATIQEAYAVLIEGLQNKFGATDKEIADLQDANDALKKALAEEVKKLYDNDQKNLDNLSNRLASHTDKLAKMIYAVEERLGKAEGKIADLEEQTTELEKAIKALQDAHATLTEQLQNKLTNIDNALAEIDETHKDDVKALQNAHALLSAQLEEALGRINGQIETLQEAVADNEKAIEANGAAIEDNKELIAKNAADIIETNTVIAELQAAFEAYKEYVGVQLKMLMDNDAAFGESIASHFNKAMGELNKTNESLAKTQEALNAAVGRIDALEEAFEAFEALAKEKFEALVAKDFELEREIETQTDLLYTAIKHLSLNVSNNANAIAQLNKAVADANELIKGLRGDVDELIARVQSMVFVPEYSDNMATINCTPVIGYGQKSQGREDRIILPRISTLKYKINAVDAEAVAKDIEAHPELVSFDVIGVQTRSAAPEALKVLNVTADKNYIVVEVMPVGFSSEFFKDRDDDDGIYSAALVLSDGNNFRSTEYTNLVANRDKAPMIFALGFTGEDGIPTFITSGDGEVYEMPCNNYEVEEHAIAPTAYFIRPDGTIWTENELASYGYGYLASVDKMAEIVTDLATTDLRDPKEGNVYDSEYFAINESPAFNFNYKVKKTEGDPWENYGKESTVTYEYTLGDMTQTYSYKFILGNAKLNISIEKDINWTVALAETLRKDDVNYAKPLFFTVDIADAEISENQSIISLKSVLEQKTGSTKFYVNGTETSKAVIKFQNYTETGVKYAIPVGSYATKNAEGQYEWNKSYKLSAVTTNDALHTDYVIDIVLNLTGYENEIEIPINVDFALAAGNVQEFTAEADLLGAAYDKLAGVAEGAYDFLGYEDNEAFWTTNFDNETYRTDYNAGTYGFPYVNGTKSNWTRNLLDLNNAVLLIGRNEIKANDYNTIEWTMNPWWEVPVKFVVTGKVVKPEYTFIYSDDHVTNGVATVNGQVADGKYSIIKSDLAKYFNLARKDNKGLDGHDWTVKFEIISPELTEADEVKIADKDNNENNVTTVMDKGNSSYHYLAEGKTILDWGNYTGLNMTVRATLYVNGYTFDYLDLKLVTKDPLTLTATDFTVQRKLREDVTVQVFKSSVLTSNAKGETNSDNLILFLNAQGALKSIPYAFLYARDTYGVNIEYVLGPRGVYYYDNNGNPITLGTNKYSYDDETGHITIKGDDASAKNYYADFTAKMTSRICEGLHEVPFRITFTQPE